MEWIYRMLLYIEVVLLCGWNFSVVGHYQQYTADLLAIIAVFAKWLWLAFDLRPTFELWPHFGALSRYCRENAVVLTQRKRSLQLLHKTCSCRNNSTQSYTWDLDFICMASSRRSLLSTPKWGQVSEVSCESNDNRDNHFSNCCTSPLDYSWILA